MAVLIEIPPAFRRFTGNAARVECAPSTVSGVLGQLTARFPDLAPHIRDDSGQLRQFLNVYLNDEDIRFLGGEDCAVSDGDSLLLLPSIAGG